MAVVLIAAGLWVYSARSETRVPQLVWQNNAGFEIDPSAGPGTPIWSFGGIPMCTNIPGTAQITSLTRRAVTAT